MNKIIYIFLVFYIYSVIGWIMESTFVSIKMKKTYNRGFFIGPYCPIYGFGALIIALYIFQYKENPFTVFILTLVICSVLEYITSWGLEKLFKTRWWDYSKKPFNLNGRVCGENSILFGLCGIIMVYIIHPIFNKIINNINPTLLTILSIIFFIILVIDAIISFKLVNKLKNNLSDIELKKDSTQELKMLIQDILNEQATKKVAYLENRLIKAFPNVDLKPFVKIKNNSHKKIRNIFKKKN